MGKVDKVKGITVKSRKKMKKIAKEKFGMSDEGIERAKDVGKVIGLVAIAFVVGRVTGRKMDESNENAGKETITAIGGQVTSNTNATKTGNGDIISRNGGIIIKDLKVNGSVDIKMQ